MMGARAAARRRGGSDSVLDFAELRDFVDLKLKNYSSGMMVRLAFAVMVEADADIMLVDEVLAVGDASFAQKCMDVFRAEAQRGPHARARDPRHGDRAELLRSGDAHPRRRAPLPRRRRGGGASLLPPELRRRPRRTGRRPGGVPDVNVRIDRGLARERRGRARRERRAGRADRASTSSSRRATTSRTPSSASTSSTPTGRRCSASTAR